MFSPEQMASVAGDRTMEAQLRLAQYCEQKLVQMGEVLPARITDRFFRSILAKGSEGRVGLRPIFYDLPLT